MLGSGCACDKAVGKFVLSHLQAKNELPNMQGALERSHDNQYHLYNVDGFANHITEGAKVASPLFPHCQQHLRRKTAAAGCIANMAAAWLCSAEHKA